MGSLDSAAAAFVPALLRLLGIRLAARGQPFKPEAGFLASVGVEPSKTGVGVGSLRVVGMSSDKDTEALSPAQCHINL